MTGNKKFKTSEWVSLGHSDKVADYISEYILDKIIEKDPKARYAIECQIKDNKVTLAGEFTTKFPISYEAIAMWTSNAIEEIGYTHKYAERFGGCHVTLDSDFVEVTTHTSCQSPDIAQGVNKDAWGDQGIFFGHFCNETPEGQGIEYQKAKEVGQSLYQYAKDMTYPIGLDIKTQATVSFDEYGEYTVEQFIAAVPVIEGEMKQKELEELVKDVLYYIWPQAKGCKLIVNGTGAYTIHGPVGDSGTTGRKLVVDFYGSRSRIGGGCVDGETEYMSKDGWKRIDKYDGKEVGQLNENLELEFVQPERYIDTFHEDVYEISTEKTTNMVLSGNHNVLYRTSKGHLQKKQLAQILEESNKTKKGSHIDIPMTFKYEFKNGEKCKYTDALARIIVAHCADGTNTTDCKRYNCRMRLKKQYKIDRMRELLLESGIYNEERKYSDGFTYFYYLLPNNEKLLSKQFKNPNKETAEMIAEEVYKWDGSEKYKEYRTTKKEDADFVQFILSGITGKAHSVTEHKKAENCSQLYVVRETKKTHSNPFRKIGKNKISKLEPQKMYCFTVPTGMLLLRRNNYIFCTANSPWTKDGSKADLTLNMYAYDLARDIFNMHKENGMDVARVETEVACCIGKRDVICYATAYDSQDIPFWSDYDKIKIKPSKLIKKYKLDKPIFCKLCKDGLFTTI